MRDMGGKPHWAKNFTSDQYTLAGMYGDGLRAFNRVRDEADPTGMFLGSWHREKIIGTGRRKLELEEAGTKASDRLL